MAKGDATAPTQRAASNNGGDNNISQLIMQMLQNPGMMQSLLPQFQRSGGMIGSGSRPMGMGQGNASGLSSFASQERGLGGGPMRGPSNGQPFQPNYAGPSQAPMHNPMMMTDRMAPPPPSMMPTNNLLRPTSSPAPSISAMQNPAGSGNGSGSNFFQPNPASGGGQNYFQPRPSLPSAMPSQPVAQPMMQRPTMPTMNYSHYGNGGTF